MKLEWVDISKQYSKCYIEVNLCIMKNGCEDKLPGPKNGKITIGPNNSGQGINIKVMIQITVMYRYMDYKRDVFSYDSLPYLWK